jgi:hypothetical protein
LIESQLKTIATDAFLDLAPRPFRLRRVFVGQEIRESTNAQALTDDAARAHSIFSELNGKLFVHLAAEDSVLYSQLLKSPDAKMKAVAQRYSEEMRPISQAFKNFAVRWGSVRAIQANIDTFVKESLEILAALEQRIRREHDELYSMEDKLQLTAH